MYNKKVLIESLKKLGSAKAPTQKKDIIMNSVRGQWDNPGDITQVPGSKITMGPDPLTGKPLTQPLLGVGSNGQRQMMYPGKDYDFGNAEYVTEYPKGSEKQSFKKGGGPGDRWLASLVKQATRSNYNPIVYPVKLAGERIARLNAYPYRSKQDIIDSLFKKDYKAKYFGNNRETLEQDAAYGFGKRDLIANYFRGIDTGFEPTNYDFDSDAGLEALINEYGPLKAYLMNSQVQHEEPLSARDLMYHRFNKAIPHSEYDYPNIKILDPALSKNFNTWEDYDADKTKENFHKLFDLYGKEIIPFDIQPNTSKKPPLFSFNYSPVNPIDNVAGHMAFLQRTPKNEFQLTTRDSWGFFPPSYTSKWSMSDKFKQRQTQLMDAFGKPFILTQTNPITFKKGGVHKTKNKNSRSYSRSLDATNKFFAENYLFEKPSSRKNKIYDPHAKYYQDGGPQNTAGPRAEYVATNPDDYEYEPMPEEKAKIMNTIVQNAGKGNIAARRMMNPNAKSYTFTGNEYDEQMQRPVGVPAGEKGSHFSASMGNFFVPFIQEGENGNLQFNEYANPSDKEAIKFNTEEEANFFANHYKKANPPMMQGWEKKQGGYIETKLSPKEIQEYAKGGYIIEDISVPELDKAQKGKIVKPLEISDPKEFKYRNKMYADSLSLYNKGQQDKNTYINYLNKNGFDAKNHLGRWNTNGWVDTDVHPTIGATYNGILENIGGGFNRDNRWVAHDYTTYPLKNGSFKNVYDESPEGKLLGKRYSVYKKPVQPVNYIQSLQSIDKKPVKSVQPVKPVEEVTPLKNIPYQEFKRPEQQIIPAPPYKKPIRYSGPRYGVLAGDENLDLPEGYTQEQREAARRKFAADEFTRKTLEYQQQQRGTQPVVTRKEGGILDKAQSGLQVTGKNIIKNILIDESDLLRSLLYKGINPASYHIKEKITQMPGELYKNTINNSDRAFRTGMALKYGATELLNKLLSQLDTSEASWNKLSTKDKMNAVNAYDPLLMKQLEDIGQRRLDAWAVGLGQQQEYNTLEQTGEDTYKMLGLQHTPQFFAERKNDIIVNSFKGQAWHGKRDMLVGLTKDFYDLSPHPMQKSNPEDNRWADLRRSQIDEFLGKPVYHHPWMQTYKVGKSPDPEFTDAIYDNDSYGVRGGYRWDVRDTPEGMQWKAYDKWDLNPFEKRGSAFINPSSIAKKYLSSTYFKPLQNLEALGLVGGKPFNIENNFLVDPKTYKTIKEWEDGGSIDYTLGDTVDKATMERLRELGYTFEII